MSERALPGEILEMQTQLLQYRASLFDPETQLPTLPVVVDQVRRMLDSRGSVQVFLLCIEQEQSLEAVVGWELYDVLLQGVGSFLRNALATLSGAQSVLCQDQVRGDRFLVFAADSRHGGRLLELLSAPLPVLVEEDAEPHALTLRIGMGSIKRRPAQRVERSIYAGIADAERDFSRRGEQLDLGRLRELHRVLRERLVRTLFQPIFRVPQRTIIGYEALSRGPANTYLEAADNLLGFAHRAGLLGELEQLCVERALASAARLPLGSTIFLNLSNRGLEYLEGQAGGLARLVRGAGWTPREVVLEVTEFTYAENPDEVRAYVAALREQGFRIAIDDMGTGYSSLHILADIQPDYIKLDQMLVRDLSSEPIKRNLVSAITGFAHTSQAMVIAEGVERQEEVTVLQELGVFLLQGYFFGMPAPV